MGTPTKKPGREATLPPLFLLTHVKRADYPAINLVAMSMFLIGGKLQKCGKISILSRSCLTAEPGFELGRDKRLRSYRCLAR
jgi:hypothetical protein